jgi:hypothetical protein
LGLFVLILLEAFTWLDHVDLAIEFGGRGSSRSEGLPSYEAVENLFLITDVGDRGRCEQTDLLRPPW